MKHLLKISSGRNEDVKRYGFSLWLRGFSYEKSTDAWVKLAGELGTEEYIRFAKEKGLRYELLDANVKRNSSYKNRWVKENPPILGLYLCTYCGRLVTKKHITVDHIVAVGRAKTSLRYSRSGRDVNDLKNLCGACANCNSIKDTKGGLWVLRGKIYRHRAMRILRALFRLLLLLCLVFLGCYFWQGGSVEELVEMLKDPDILQRLFSIRALCDKISV